MSTPIEEYERIFGFMTVNNMPDGDEIKKQAYLQSYRIYVFVVYSWVPILASFFIYYFSKGIGDRRYVSDLADGILYAFWHWGFPKDDHLFYTRACGAMSLSWAFWLIWRLYRDATDRGVFLREDVQDAFPRILQLGLLMLLGALFFFAFSFLGPFNFSSLSVPSANDSVHVYALKKCAMISCGYWLLGFSSLLVSTCIRWAYGRK